MPIILGMAVAFGCIITLVVKEVASGLSRGVSATSLMAVETRPQHPTETNAPALTLSHQARADAAMSLELTSPAIDDTLATVAAPATREAKAETEVQAQVQAPAVDVEAEPAPVREAAAPAPAPARATTTTRDDTPMFNGRPLRKVREVNMLVTAYSPDERSCGIWADGITASGYSVWTNGMRLVAADTRILPFGSLVSVPGYNGGRPVPVLDRGGAIKGNRLDVLYPTHEIALRWGAQRLPIIIWEYADE